MRVAVVGATGRTGRLVVEQALDRGLELTALARQPDDIDARSDRLLRRAADVMAIDTMAGAFDDVDAVISTLGVGTSRAPTEVYSVGVSNILACMPPARACRLVTVSAVPVDRRADHPGFQRRVLLPILWTFFGSTYADMQRMEQVLEAGEANWTVVRPPRLIEKPATGSYRLSLSPRELGGTVRYADLATALLDLAESDNYRRQAVYVSN